MGFDLDGYLGRELELRRWRERLPSVVVCPLHGDLALVPLTSALGSELRGRLGEAEARRLDAAQPHPTWPSPSQVAAVRLWGRQASAWGVVVYVSLGEFGNQSHEEATVWSRGAETLSLVSLSAGLEYLKVHAGLRFEDPTTTLEKHRGENAGEKWAAEALRAGRG